MDENWFDVNTKVVRSLEFCEVCLWFKTMQVLFEDELYIVIVTIVNMEYVIWIMDYYNRDDYLSFGGESVKLLLRFVRYVLSQGISVPL